MQAADDGCTFAVVIAAYAANSTPYPKLSDGVNRIICSDEMRPRLEARDTFAVGGTPEDFDGFIATETSKWAKVIRDVSVKAQQAQKVTARRLRVLLA